MIYNGEHVKEFRKRFDDAFGNEYRYTEQGEQNCESALGDLLSGKIVILYKSGGVALIGSIDRTEIVFEIIDGRVIFRHCQK